MEQEIYTRLFNKIKNHEFDNFKEILLESNEIDVNTRDEQNEYLMTYAVLYNNLEIIKLLYEMGARIDIIDNEERSILYLCIKYGYDKIISFFIEKNNENIGINILDIKDKLHKIPLHYAIQKKNINIIKLLLDSGSNPSTSEHNGYNSLHLAVFTHNLEICNLIIKYIGNVNARCSTGETALHLSTNLRLYEISKLLIDNGINVNLADTVHEFTALHYICTTNQIELLKYVLSKGKPNINSQDIFGNTCLHYSIIEQNYSIINELMKYEGINFNLWNIDGRIPLHHILENYDDRYEQFLDIIIQKSNVSIKDNDGNSPLFYLISLDLWKKYKNILEHKKIDVYAKNKKSVMLLDIIKEKDRDEFLNMVTSSYYNRLKLKPGLWTNEWENVCSKDVLSDNIDNNKVFKKNINNSKELEDSCKATIRKTILKNLEKIKSGEKDCKLTSYPQTKNKVCIYVEEGENIPVCTFTGNTLDVLLGLVYLLNKYRDVCSTLSTDFTENKSIYDFYKSSGILMTNRTDFLNFEIVWAGNKLYLVDNFYEKIKKCIKNSKFIIIPLGIEMKEGSHANYIIYDVEKKIMERFEPHGATTPPGLNYNPDLLDSVLITRFKDIDDDITYIKPKDFLPKISFQLLDILETKKKKIGDPGGFCALWAIWYVDMRLTYRDIPSDVLVKKLIKSIKTNNVSVKNMIRNYSVNIIKLRDDILNSASIDINDWVNDEYDDEKVQLVIDKIRQIIAGIK